MAKFFKQMGIVGGIATILLLAGGLNWGILGLMRLLNNPNPEHYNLVTILFGGISPILENLVYILVGLSAIYSAYALFVKKK